VVRDNSFMKMLARRAVSEELVIYPPVIDSRRARSAAERTCDAGKYGFSALVRSGSTFDEKRRRRRKQHLEAVCIGTGLIFYRDHVDLLGVSVDVQEVH
jgi:hypothetical protein